MFNVISNRKMKNKFSGSVGDLMFLNSMYSSSKSNPRRSFDSKMDFEYPDQEFDSIKFKPRKSVDSFFVGRSNRQKTGSCRREQTPLKKLLYPLLKHKLLNAFCFCRGNPASSSSSFQAKAKVHTNILVSEESPKIYDGRRLSLSKTHSIVQFVRQSESHSPCFLFSIDTEVILVAVKEEKRDSKIHEFELAYTFLSINDHLQKDGIWVSSNIKGKNHGLVGNPVALMKTSWNESCFMTKEFVLCEFEGREGVFQDDEIWGDEIAAIIVQVHKKKVNLNGDLCEISSFRNRRQMNSSESSESAKEKKVQIKSSEDQHCDKVIAILPAGNHGGSSRTIDYSSLIQRWRTGICDCEGWDLGCRLTVLVSENTPRNLSTFHSFFNSEDNQVDMLEQGGIGENNHAFRLVEFKPDFYSVDYNAQISPLQAFSICVGILDSRSFVLEREIQRTVGNKTGARTQIPRISDTQMSISLAGKVQRFSAIPTLNRLS